MMTVQGLNDWEWASARSFLPFDLDTFAKEHGALERGIEDGESLVRSLLLVGLPHASLERAAQMARQSGLAKMNTTAFFKRLCQAESMLESIFFHTLGYSVGQENQWAGYRLLAVDATVLCGPGALGTDQRLHTVYDLGKGLPLSAELTGPEGGETLRRHRSFGKGDLLLADGGYGYNRSLRYALRSGARILIRFQFGTVKLFDPQGHRIKAEQANAQVLSSRPIERCVELPDWPSPLRAIGALNPKGEPVWLLTDLSQEELPIEQVRELYRRRWQVELFFKRLKSLLHLDELPTRDGPTARAWIWAKLVLASLAVLLAHERFSPWGPEQCLEAFRSWDARSDAHPSGTRSETPRRKTQRQTKTPRTPSETIYILEA
jgi:hypothetical protein